jgi:hypothetical protein
MSVIAFPGINMADVPAMLHVLADQIATGEYGEARGLAYAFVTDGDDMYCNLLGRISQIEGVGLMAMASTMLQTMGDEE